MDAVVQNRTRNQSFDLLKAIACFAVVFMHCEFPGRTGVAVQCLTRWSVPLYFTISGYFFRRESVGECMRKARHILRITCFAVAFYVVFETAAQLIRGGIPQLIRYVEETCTPFDIVTFILFNGPVFFSGHLWFLFALLYVYLAYAVMIRLRLTRINRVVCVLLLAGHFSIAYGLNWLGHPLPSGAYRNWAFEGLPFFLIGHEFFRWSASWGEEEKRRYAVRGKVLICVGLALSLLERALLGRDFSVHLASVIVLAGMLFLAQSPLDRRWSWLAAVGREYSLYVYILHMAVYRLFAAGSLRLGWSGAALVQWLQPVNTVVWTLLAAKMLLLLKNHFSGRKV